MSALSSDKNDESSHPFLTRRRILRPTLHQNILLLLGRRLSNRHHLIVIEILDLDVGSGGDSCFFGEVVGGWVECTRSNAALLDVGLSLSGGQ